MNQSFDAIVIGAGYIGSSVAYHLSKAGLKTAIFDLGSMAAGASRANYGNIQIQDLELQFSVPMIQMARTRFATLEQELDWDLGLRKLGGLLPIENENQWNILAEREKNLQAIGIASELIQANRLQEVEPSIDAAHLLGGLYHADEGQLDPFQLINAYLTRARQSGLQEYYYCPVTGFELDHTNIKSIRTPTGNFSADHIVFCTGAYSNHLGKKLGLKWDVLHYVLGQAMVTEPLPIQLRNHLASASFFEMGADIPKGVLLANMAISQSTHGNLLLGESMYEADHFRTHLPNNSLPWIARSVLKYFPAFKNLRVLRGWSAAIADTRDGLPLFGPVAAIDGLYLATAFRSTVIITPLVGETIAQLITTGTSQLDIQAFLPERNAYVSH
ncbi:MAG: FAD-binding oxidoreductase [Anaerolineaceae bacterium]|nr:FAD-binding oxidoreductase [Anaerolineaceae bacterium]